MNVKSDHLSFSIIQSDIAWEQKEKNLEHYAQLIDGINTPKEIVVLPEMFSTGFSMNATALAEEMDGATLGWMRDTAARHKIILTGSIIIREGENYFNRLIWMQPDGHYYCYDKRHLFGFAGEDASYSAGEKKIIVQVKGWKICPLICYDLRFPVWARNVLKNGEPLYDILLYVANWPTRRSTAWKTLLQARAIENQCFCLGVNRVGEDGKGITYEGASSVFDPLGEVIWQNLDTAAVHTVVLQKETLNEVRNKLPFLKDSDNFILP